ncbi:MAG: serine protease, partial [Prevotellaceae bacterium]|nr:serine protease [Prevotellaceae bacterium]
MRLFLLVFFISTCPSIRSQSRIIGGGEINIQKAPWMANIRVVNTAGAKLFNRSGIIISENLVITASHNWPVQIYDHLEVHVGGTSESDGKYRRVHRFIQHPDFDITLLELSEPLDFDSNIQPIDYKTCMDESLYVPGTDAVIYGWGKECLETGAASLKLRSADVKIISKEEANMIYGAAVVPDDAIASKGKTIQMAGKGDSGGALVVSCSMQNPALVGITTLADTRDESENSGLTVYAKVKPIIEWIDSCKCELTGRDTVPSTGGLFEIANMPPEVKSVEWTYSGLTEINS